ncbi:lysophospholipid acyltransferase family protein [Rossellomorea vietnamensis]|uniref:lysophospholipid acyltransferase family protein n=1 Tax=Rossellomorea vietnamensis TaxID=218284 RepID=UPI0005585828|nr:lysophospholipid acyltransferase family protein [Rossellomorea vietnamensis]OXS58666.1 1-acyl-sn-glycerol-3-phosphate acyltransferase [Bacillus sp. DSM 27956]PRX75576.1 1-acyl-sn-glycerol-3-phosphate acyltransferase [Bacillus sp. V-88]MCA0147794.1 1-acyl-sn-glycerol-3-phosphate acyltransferase [Rossellomorea vietnamensis]MCC5800382.1 1-acyl-sn-glycerol-3-phosphate acyltransferase [Rossellomorea vietnamensis]SLK23520.1 1-acyl-sn-glycerol-3-phosphate acyltransferase [Bacillus sp. V-88]
MNLYTFARGLVKSILSPLYRIEVKGLEHFPEDGGVLLCANHIDNLDPPVVGISAPRPVSFMAKEELFNVPVLGKLLPDLRAFPVKRGMSDREALRKGLKILKQGDVLGLFPEGTRSKTGQIGKGLAGAGFFALRSEAYVVPCAIIGPYKPFRKLKVVFGPPIPMDSIREERLNAEKTTEIIMKHIEELILANQ